VRGAGLALLLAACVHVAPAPEPVDPAAAQRVLQLYAKIGTPLDPSKRGNPTVDLALELEQQGFPFGAAIFQMVTVKGGPTNPGYAKAVEATVRLQQRLHDPMYIPAFLFLKYDPTWESLPAPVLGRVDFLLAVMDFHRGNLTEALELAKNVKPEDPLHAKARYLCGLVLANPRLADGAREEEALVAFREAAAAGEGQEDAEQVRALAMLAIGRVTYGLGRYAESVAAYERAESTSQRTTARFEGAFARFQKSDLNVALAQLQDPEVRARFPEAHALEALIEYFRQDYARAAELAGAMRALYPPAVEETNWLRQQEALVAQVDAELTRVATVEAWRGSTFAQELATYLDQNLAALRSIAKAARNRREENNGNELRFMGSMGQIIELEATLAQAELSHAPARFDRPIKLLRELLGQLPAGTPAWADASFHLADLLWDKALTLDRRHGKPLLLEAVTLLEELLGASSDYLRADEVLYMLGNLNECLDEPLKARSAYDHLLRMKSPLLPDATNGLNRLRP
jgi:tetratricopeptide (TPR) repeat protein